MKKILGCVAFVMGIAGINTMSYGMMTTPFPYDAVIEANQNLFYDALNEKEEPIKFGGLPVKVLPIRFFHNKTSDDINYGNDALIEWIPHLPLDNPLRQMRKTHDKTVFHKRKQQIPNFNIRDAALTQIPYGEYSLVDIILCRQQNFLPCNLNIRELLEFVRRYNTDQLAHSNSNKEIKLLVFDLAWDNVGYSKKISHMFRGHVARPGDGFDDQIVAPDAKLHESYFVFPTELDLSQDSQRIMTTMLLIGLGEPLSEEQGKTGTIRFHFSDPVSCYCIPKGTAELQECPVRPVKKQQEKKRTKHIQGTPSTEIVENPLSIMKIYIR